MIHFTIKHPQATLQHLGYIPQFLDERNPLSARDRHTIGTISLKGIKK